MELEVSSYSLDRGELLDILRTCEGDVDRSSPGIGGNRPALRGGTDPTVLVAVLSGASVVLSALITGFLNILRQRVSPAATIVIRSPSGASIEFPADTTPERVTELVNTLNELSHIRIELP